MVAREPEREFGWVVGDPDHPSAAWRFTLEPDGDGTVLRQWMRMGPAPSGLNLAIDARPDKEERIVARRLEEHRATCRPPFDGIRQLAEQVRPPGVRLVPLPHDSGSDCSGAITGRLLRHRRTPEIP